MGQKEGNMSEDRYDFRVKITCNNANEKEQAVDILGKMSLMLGHYEKRNETPTGLSLLFSNLPMKEMYMIVVPIKSMLFGIAEVKLTEESEE